MAALRIEEGEAVEEGVQKFFDLLTWLEGADLNYSEFQKKTKLLALLPESWSLLIINLNRDLPRLSLEDVKRWILQEDTIVTRAEICGAIAIIYLMDGLLLKAKRVEEQEEGEEEAVEAVGVVEVVLQMGKAMFKGADGKMVGLKNVLWVPNLAANLISVRRLQKAGMDTSSKGAKTYTARLGERILWDLHKNRDVYNEMWHIPVVPMPKERQVAASISTKGEAVGSDDGTNGHAKEIESKKCNLGGTSKLHEHEESGAAANKKHKGEENPKAAAEEEFGENISETTAKAPLDEVVMDVVGPLKLGAAGAKYFLTIVDVYNCMTWVYIACVAKNRALTHVGAEKWVPYVEWIGRKPKVDMLRVFGCMCMALVPKHLRHNKLGANTIWAVHLGMAQNSKGWLLWDPFTKKFLVRRDCKFMENLMYKDWKAENEVKIGVQFGEVKSSGLEQVELPLELRSDSTTTRQSSLVNGGEEAKDAEEEEEEVQQVSERAPTLPSRTTSAPRIRVTPQQRHESLHVCVAEEEGRGKRRIQAPSRLTYDACGKPPKLALAEAALSFLILILSLSSDLVKGVMLKLEDKFKCKALGDVKFYLGLHIERDVEKRCMRVHQRKYLEALAANFG
ncbi:unnamed protein product [Closterium sp. NIES-53]